jgi:hypothetical protein
VRAATGAHSECGVDIAIDPDNYYDVNLADGTLLMRKVDHAIHSDATNTIDPAQPLSVRMRHDATSAIVVFETSLDGSVWTMQQRMAATCR